MIMMDLILFAFTVAVAVMAFRLGAKYCTFRAAFAAVSGLVRSWFK